MIAVIMAGGKSTRMGKRIEKPILRLGKETLLDRSVAAVENSRAADLIVATTASTPKTTKLAIKRGYAVLETPGIDYHEDVYFLLGRIGPYVSLNVDIPFITPAAIDRLISKSKEESIACVLPRERVSYPVDDDSVGDGRDGKPYVWIGLNYVTPSKETDLLVMEDERLAININTPLDLAFAWSIVRSERKKKPASSRFSFKRS
jgi:GTP:adenosylcobinamide-phosphate guanylyltransferase